ncbi:MAG: ABC transporter ATP-binding protein, partial [[Ruminococcus] gnavus]|nr:ABC transporter ATP-binding protein [Mediterraneibacter gnavus]
MKIELKKIRHVYPTGDEALKGIDLVIEGTEPVAIIGQNGAGKTTIVKHFNGILRPTSGEVLINGESIEKRSTAQWSKKVGYVFQNPDDQLFLESVRKEFEFGPQKIGMPQEEIDERMKWVAELVGLSEKLDVHPFDLTS